MAADASFLGTREVALDAVAILGVILRSLRGVLDTTISFVNTFAIVLKPDSSSFLVSTNRRL